ncbi:MAG: hypothetical protein V9H69_01715 [Anaerolineae bacterium]
MSVEGQRRAVDVDDGAAILAPGPFIGRRGRGHAAGGLAEEAGGGLERIALHHLPAQQLRHQQHQPYQKRQRHHEDAQTG